MRNLLLLVAALGLTTAANAQDIAKTDIVGASNTTTIDQVHVGATGAANANIANIKFVGDDNVGRIEQEGRGNDALSASSPGLQTTGNQNNTLIQQIGDELYGRIRVNGDLNGDVSGNALEVLQSGRRHRAQLFITGDDNDGYVDQVDPGNTNATRNFTAFAGGGTSANGLQGRAVRNADNTTLQVRQRGGATLTGYVGGNGNTIRVDQDGFGNTIGTLSESSYDGINVYGDDNTVDVLQRIGGNAATVTIDGLAGGNNNMVDVDQTTAGNLATVTISGNGNSSTISQ